MENEMVNYINETAHYILRVLMVDNRLPMSWGMQHPTAVYIDQMAGLEFIVNGYIHQGKVQVLLNEGTDTFDVRLINPDGSRKSIDEDVYVDVLAYFVNGLVEKTEDYENCIKEEYNVILL